MTFVDQFDLGAPGTLGEAFSSTPLAAMSEMIGMEMTELGPMELDVVISEPLESEMAELGSIQAEAMESRLVGLAPMGLDPMSAAEPETPESEESESEVSESEVSELAPLESRTPESGDAGRGLAPNSVIKPEAFVEPSPTAPGGRFALTIADASGPCFQGAVLGLRLHSALGVYEALPGHCPMILKVLPGEVQVLPAHESPVNSLLHTTQSSSAGSHPGGPTVPESPLQSGISVQVSGAQGAGTKSPKAASSTPEPNDPGRGISGKDQGLDGISHTSRSTPQSAGASGISSTRQNDFPTQAGLRRFEPDPQEASFWNPHTIESFEVGSGLLVVDGPSARLLVTRVHAIPKG